MQSGTYHILRVGMGITFLWIGVLIFRDPEAWGGYLLPWAMGALPMSLEEAMIGTAILDILVGILLLVDVATWIAALIATIHLVVVLVVSGINGVTVRDIGLLGGTLAIMWPALPEKIRRRFAK